MVKNETEKIIEGVKIFKKDGKKDFGLERVIIFGSAARKKINENSDIDLILVSRKFSGTSFVKRPLGLRRIWRLRYPVDFLCYTPREFEIERKKVSIVSEAVRDGIEV